MRTISKTFIFSCIVIIPFVSVLSCARAYTEETYTVSSVYIPETTPLTAATWNTIPHPRINTFTMRDDGSAYGMTETGIPFTQENVANDLGIRIQIFSIADYHHYIIEGEIAYTFEDFSAKLADAYNRVSTT